MRTIGRNYQLCLIAFAVFFAAQGTLGLLSRSKITLRNNGYSGLLVAINEDIPENVTLVDRLKEILTDTSRFLYRATHQRAYFKEIIILLPKTWSDSIDSVPATTEIFDAANIIVDKPHTFWQDNPYTNQFGSCGEEAEYIHLTERFILDKQNTLYYFGDPARVMVHEWGHLRWGLFDEYATTDSEHFYLNEDRQVEVTRCSKHVTGKEYNYKTGKRCNVDPKSGKVPDKNCRFYPDLDNQQATGSLMFMSFLDSVVEFCHSESNGDPNSLHNIEAPNQQNIQCSYRSAWDVMLESEDFKNNNNPPRDVADTTPTFRIVKSAPLRIVLVLDVSGSMSSNNRIGILNQIVTKYVRNTVPEDNFIGIVQFSNTATITSYLRKLRTNADRETLARVLPTSTGGSTCIGCGLNAAVQVLEYGGNSARGGVILMVTDGGENVTPYLNDVKPSLRNKGVSVDTVAFSNAADTKLLSLSEDTGGLSFYFTESDDSTGLNDALTTTITSRLSGSSSAAIELLSSKQTISSTSRKITDSVFIDGSIGKDTKFFFLWSTSRISVVMHRPNGNVISSSSPEYKVDDAKKTVTIEIPGIAETGEWRYEVSGAVQAVETSAQSSARVDTQPIRITARTDNSFITATPAKVVIYAQVRRGYTPILRATAKATVERPSPYSPVEVTLLDNGSGVDVTKDDGVYSGAFLDFVTATCPNCRYNIKVTAEDKDGVAEVPVANNFLKSRVLPLRPLESFDEVTNETEYVGKFSRVVSGGVIQAPVTIPPGDNFPPSRITDLRVVGTSYDNQTITLAWTAPGNDLDRGTADEYVLRYSKNFTYLSKDFTSGGQLTVANVTEGNLLPKQFGEEETVTVQMPKTRENITYYFAVRARDLAGNEAPPSNIISAAIVYFVESTEAPTTHSVTTPEIQTTHARTTMVTDLSTITDALITTTIASFTTNFPPTKNQPLTIIISCSVIATVILLAVITITSVYVYKKHAMHKETNKTNEIECGTLEANEVTIPLKTQRAD